MSKILTLIEVAEMLSLKPNSVRIKVRAGEITGFFKIRNQWRIKQEDLDAWIEEQKKKQELVKAEKESEKDSEDN